MSRYLFPSTALAMMQIFFVILGTSRERPTADYHNSDIQNIKNIHQNDSQKSTQSANSKEDDSFKIVSNNVGTD